MVLTIEIGNTRTCYGLFEDDSINPFKTWMSTTYKNVTDDVKENMYSRLLKEDIDFSKLTTVAISCVVPVLIPVWEGIIKNCENLASHKINFMVCNSKTVQKLDKQYYDCQYAHPEEVAGDIITSCIAAKTLYSYPCAIVDFGTATNINVIDNNGKFIGTVIAPGVETSLNSLIKNASALSNIEIKAPKKVLGESTKELVQSGIVFGEASKIDGLINRIEKEIGSNVDVYCVGGFAKLISKHMEHEYTLTLDLILQGLKIFVDRYYE